MTDIERLSYDVVVIGAGGSGLRAAIEARLAGQKTAIISKSLFGKAHTVMAEGGAAAAMGNVNPNDNWQVHFRDTMRGGKFMNNWRMAELHAKESPDRVWELEAWGAVFDRTPDGKISQRNFGGHEYPRLAHVGDRTGLEMIRTLQQKVVALQQEDAAVHGDPEAMIKVFAETTITRLLTDGERIAGAFGYIRETGRFVMFEAPAVILATGGIGKTFKVTSNSWEYTGDGHALALLAGATLLNMEFVQFHPTHMVWPLSVAGLLVTESVRGDGGVLRNSEGKRFMFGYVPDVFRAQYAETEEEADRWYTDQANNRRPPELLPRDEVARQISAEGGAAYNPGWHLALDMRNIMLIAECVALAALERQESRGGHTRDDFPAMSPEWRKDNLICTLDGGRVTVTRQPMAPMRADLLALFERSELKKYLTEAELPADPAPESALAPEEAS